MKLTLLALLALSLLSPPTAGAAEKRTAVQNNSQLKPAKSDGNAIFDSNKKLQKGKVDPLIFTLSVTSTLPANGQQGFTNSNATATFNNKINPSTVNKGTFYVVCDDNPVDANVQALTGNPYVAIFWPPMPFPKGADCQATVTTGVEDVSGNHLDKNYTWNFTTEVECPEGYQLLGNDENNLYCESYNASSASNKPIIRSHTCRYAGAIPPANACPLPFSTVRKSEVIYFCRAPDSPYNTPIPNTPCIAGFEEAGWTGVKNVNGPGYYCGIEGKVWNQPPYEGFGVRKDVCSYGGSTLVSEHNGDYCCDRFEK